MSGLRKLVTVQLEGITLGCAVINFHLFEKLALEYGVTDIYEVQINLVMSATALAFPEEANPDALAKALNNLRIDAQVTEVER